MVVGTSHDRDKGIRYMLVSTSYDQDQCVRYMVVGTSHDQDQGVRYMVVGTSLDQDQGVRYMVNPQSDKIIKNTQALTQVKSNLSINPQQIFASLVHTVNHLS